ncbi:DUF452 family protein [Neisseria weixii]|uniref:DUF452 family protein n=2 Tax=Neisseria weixii TaxID=1853276 RepID=A0A3N4NUK9_9NEIS|nr:pimeloyl-ACP methyl esterase BioG family protein [Neisseria weixii]ATD66033.1 hypothetical protein CGZ65_11850 [Neisseria weixii]RPD90863.1 DUF452 family protein [Neisseria weixii]RPD91057.1 DUF452 family protein [Neisseria weixii]
MHTRLISQPNADTLLVYFAGWGTPDSVAEAMAPAADVLLCSDYRDTVLNFDFSRYRRIGVLAWSMGVWVAERAMQGVKVDWAAAVNGTGFPYDDQFGIPCAVFDQTLARFDERNRAKFEQRMCADADSLAHYRRLDGHRSQQSLHDELSFLHQAVQADHHTDLLIWHEAWIGARDRIIPAANQSAYWQSRCPVIEFDGGHYPYTHWPRWNEAT